MGCCASNENATDQLTTTEEHGVDEEVEQMKSEKKIESVTGEYEFGGTLGSGASCQVVLGTHKTTKQEVAIKVMDSTRPVTQKLYEQEISILARLSINTQRYKEAAHAKSQSLDEKENEIDDTTRDLIKQYTPSSSNAGYDNVLHFVGHGTQNDQCYVITELLRGGELFDRIITKSENYKVNGYIIAGRLVKQMLEAVKYCHDHNIVHRDLKPENFVFASREVNSNLVLIDYGCAQVLDDPNNDLQKIVGTAYYLAPELAFNAWYTYWLRSNNLMLDEETRKENMEPFVKLVSQLKSQRIKGFDSNQTQSQTNLTNEKSDHENKDTEEMLGVHSPKNDVIQDINDDPNVPLLSRYQKRTSKMLKAADVWSIGVIAYVMLTGRAPFRGKGNAQIFENIVTREWRFPAKDARYGDKLSAKNVPEQFRKFLDKTLIKDPLKRPTIEELLNDPFVKGIDSRSYVLNTEVLRYIKQFKYQSHLKKAITRVLAQNMTEQPARQVELHFNRVDVDSDGQLNEEELIRVCEDSGYDAYVARVMARRAIIQFDRNGDGLINPDEFKQMWYSKVLTENDNYIARVFEVFDDNGDGQIDENELKMILFSDVAAADGEETEVDEFQTAMNERMQRIKDMIKEVDRDDDGKISFNEFFDAMTEKTDQNEEPGANDNENGTSIGESVFANYGVVGGDVELDQQVSMKYPTEQPE